MLNRQMRSEGDYEMKQHLRLFNSKNLISARAQTRDSVWVLNASISMQMCISASADYLPLGSFPGMTFPPHVMTLFAPLSCLSDIEPFFFMTLWSVCLNRIRALEAYKWDSRTGFMQNKILCVGQIR